MSNKWWDQSKTTTGRGIFSQYNPDSVKEWVERERKLPREPRGPEPTLEQLRTLQRPPPTPDGFTTSVPRALLAHLEQPLKSPTLPQYSHHHHFGWLPPTPERRIAGSFTDRTPKQSGHAYSYGIANGHNQQIHNTHVLISTRKP